ncbi:hypothetical protein C8R43DRAFT_960039 [Mycena crocata]|nr:hypothetical protein C8R43DRAFT_960039 [Mycena crocata]
MPKDERRNRRSCSPTPPNNYLITKKLHEQQTTQPTESAQRKNPWVNIPRRPNKDQQTSRHYINRGSLRQLRNFGGAYVNRATSARTRDEAEVAVSKITKLGNYHWCKNPEHYVSRHFPRIPYVHLAIRDRTFPSFYPQSRMILSRICADCIPAFTYLFAINPDPWFNYYTAWNALAAAYTASQRLACPEVNLHSREHQTFEQRLQHVVGTRPIQPEGTPTSVSWLPENDAAVALHSAYGPAEPSGAGQGQKPRRASRAWQSVDVKAPATAWISVLEGTSDATPVVHKHASGHDVNGLAAGK